MTSSISAVTERLTSKTASVDQLPILAVHGQITRWVGLTIEAKGLTAPIGAMCHIQSDEKGILAEVVGFSEDVHYLMPLSQPKAITPGTPVRCLQQHSQVPVGDGLLGRVIDANGDPIDGKGGIKQTAHRSLQAEIINPFERSSIEQPLDIGVRAINGLLTLGRGQRIGLFAGTGVGKSMLIGMITRNTQADVVVVGLIGERGREVNDFIHENLGEAGLARAVVVAEPADRSALLRCKGALTATAIAEHFRDQGKHVLLIMDSLSRYAYAVREIGLAAGEIPANKGYPPSVFAKIPQLIERAGNGAIGQGTLTAIYTVLLEGDDHHEPIADTARGILDGHIVLSRELAEQGVYPAIDIERSISRIMIKVISQQQQMDAMTFKKLYSLYQNNKDLITMGAYSPGQNPDLDRAVKIYPLLLEYIRQSESLSLETCIEQLHMLLQVSDEQASA